MHYWVDIAAAAAEEVEVVGCRYGAGGGGVGGERKKDIYLERAKFLGSFVRVCSGFV